MQKFLLLLLLICLIAAPSAAAQQAGLADAFGDTEGTFLLYDAQTDILTVYNPDRAAVRYPPFSTFKIVNSSIALETGTIPDENFVIAYDPARDRVSSAFPDWARDHDLRSAIKDSVVWYYIQLAGMIGEEQMGAHISRIAYGNQDISAWLGTNSIRPFWLGGSLEISAYEQLDFLRHFYNGELFSERTTEIVKDIIILEETDSYRLSGKTGSRGDNTFCWQVGYVERGAEVYFYVINVDTTRQGREAVLHKILTEQGLLD